MTGFLPTPKTRALIIPALSCGLSEIDAVEAAIKARCVSRPLTGRPAVIRYPKWNTASKQRHGFIKRKVAA